MCISTLLRIVKVERPMRTIRYVLLVILCFLGARAAHAQRIPIVVLDSLDDQPIPRVSVSAGEHSTSTSSDGTCTLPWDGISVVTVSFTHVAYKPVTLTLYKNIRLYEGAWVVRLSQRQIILEGATVGAPKPEVVFLRPDLHAADLVINEAGIWVLAYERPRLLKAENEARDEILRDVVLVLLDTNFRERGRVRVPEDVKGLCKDLRDQVLIEGTVQAYSVELIEGYIALHPLKLDDLRKGVLPWTDSIPGYMLGTNADQVYPAFDHIAYDPVGDSARVVCSVVDTFMLELFRSEYKYLNGHDRVVAMDLADELHVDKEVVAGYMRGFQHNIWFRPLYAPLFVVGDTMIVFDHAQERMRKFTRDMEPAGTCPLNYLAKGEKRNWARRVIQDRHTRKLYAVYKKYGAMWLRSIDPITGAMTGPSRITYEYPERLQVHGEYAYYIYRPFESLQKKSIYRERVR
jgi:hypothetical protein